MDFLMLSDFSGMAVISMAILMQLENLLRKYSLEKLSAINQDKELFGKYLNYKRFSNDIKIIRFSNNLKLKILEEY